MEKGDKIVEKDNWKNSLKNEKNWITIKGGNQF